MNESHKPDDHWDDLPVDFWDFPISIQDKNACGWDASLLLDGDGDWVSAPDTALPTGAQSRTIFVRFESRNLTGRHALVSWGNSNPTEMFSLLTIGSQIAVTQSGSESLGGSLVVHQCYDAFVTLDGDLTLEETTIYLDGVSVVVDNPIVDTVLSGNLYIGRSGDGDTENEFHGCVSDVRIWDRVLDSTDRGLVRADSPGTNSVPTGLLRWYQLQTDLADSGGGSHDGTAVGDAAIGNCPDCPGSALSVVVTLDPASGDSPLSVDFSAAPSGGVGPYTYSWTIEDGSPNTSTAASGTTVITIPGNKTFTVVVTDACGTEVTESDSINVAAAP